MTNINLLLWLQLQMISISREVFVQNSHVDWDVGVADTFWLFIFTLNRAKNRFNSIFNSKLNQTYSFKKLFIQIGKINSKNYSIQNWIKNIHSNWKNNLSLRKQWKTCKMGRFFLKTHFLFIFLMNIALFWFIQKFIQ